MQSVLLFQGSGVSAEQMSADAHEFEEEQDELKMAIEGVVERN